MAYLTLSRAHQFFTLVAVEVLTIVVLVDLVLAVLVVLAVVEMAVTTLVRMQHLEVYLVPQILAVAVAEVVGMVPFQ
jgi:hypothetical protein